MKFTNEELKVLRGMTNAGNWPISGSALKPLLHRLDAAEKVARIVSQGFGGLVLEDAIVAWRCSIDEESD